ncbi:uncharacterized protein LOC141689150 isoform X2 [Apium graveolens]|uniref:uncharacterized protein LOC141689150 isoform X2 n=1 Tax=Apium graveolens TaxID=4045 RepID=UPI003D797CAB
MHLSLHKQLCHKLLQLPPLSKMSLAKASGPASSNHESPPRIFPMASFLHLAYILGGGRYMALRIKTSQTSISDDAYSLIRRVLSEVSVAVKSLEGIDRVARAELNEMIEKLAIAAFPDKTDPVQQASWEQYMRIGTELIDQVMQNFEKVIVEAGTSERVPGEHTRLLLEMDDERDLDPNLFYCPLYE